MTFEEFHQLVTGASRPVVLVEGTRSLPERDVEALVSFARWMARRYPHAVFRTGNAEGSDAAFARGVASVDPSRLEYVLPYEGHRKESVEGASYQVSLGDLPRVAEERAVYVTGEASPEYEGMMARRDKVPKLKAKARYILRDTIKVVGAEQASLAPATVGVFYVNAADPMKGGTGHTIRVCRTQGVPVVFQDEWMAWPKL